MCVCGQHDGSSQESFWLWENLRAFFRKDFWKKKKVPSALRVLLEEHRIVIQFSAVQFVPASEPQSLPEDVWFCPAYVNYGNFHFAALQLFPSDELPQRATDLFSTDVQMLQVGHPQSASGMVLNDVELFRATVSFACKLQCRFWQICDETELWPIGNSSEHLPVVPCQSDPFFVWQGLQGEKLLRRGQSNKRKSQHSGMAAGSRPKQARETRPKRNQNTEHEPLQDNVDKDFLEPEPFDLLSQFDDVSVLEPEALEWLEDDFGEHGSNDEDNDSLEDMVVDTGIKDFGLALHADKDDEGLLQLDDGDLSDFDPSSASSMSDFGFEDPNNDQTQNAAATTIDSDKNVEAHDVPAEPAAAAVAASSSSSASVAVPAPKSPAEPTTRASRAVPSSRTDTLLLDLGVHGSIRYNPVQESFIAACSWPGHGDCRLTRTAKASSLGGKKTKGQGRPLGLLYDWLLQSADFDSHKNHLHSYTATLTARQTARKELMKKDGAREFSQDWERKKRDGEDSEPEHIR